MPKQYIWTIMSVHWYNPCLNTTCGNGTCTSLNSSHYICMCDKGFRGENCENMVRDCESNPCYNHGICHDLINSYECDCDNTGYTGAQCNMDINECNSSPCLNDGTCFNRIGDYICLCTPGFEGINCDVNINECQSNPCLNEGVCIDGINGYSCQCDLGYYGTRCENEVDNCIGNQCNPITEVCISEPTRHYCVCKKGYGGANCTDVNECLSDPCLNNATCVNGIDKFTCICMPGYAGYLCQQDINECENEPCQNSAICMNEINDYNCICELGWTGKNCSEVFAPCDSSPCHNGTCDIMSHDNPPGYACTCMSGFSGNNCEINIDDCANVTCSYNEICMDKVNEHQCICNPGYTMDNIDNCTIEINECSSNPCENNASCIDLINNYECNCTYGYGGRNCEMVINFCESMPCFNGGHCQSDVGSYRCFCVPGFVGLHCEHTFNACNSNPCVNDAMCSSQLGLYHCECQPGYQGVNCHLDINECDSNPCRNDGNCTNLVANFSCSCTTGWSGEQCEINVNECESNPCQNGAECIDQVASYTCECLDGYTGAHCQTNINECEDKPCLHNGSCIDGIAKFTCICNNTGYMGPICEDEINECNELQPCSNGGLCTDLVNAYNCTCLPGYIGTHCEHTIAEQIDIDECLSTPCVNGGTCHQRSNTNIYGSIIKGNFSYDNSEGFVCICSNGYKGVNCETEIDECLTIQPCSNNSTCVDHIADYICHCGPGFGGRNCSVPLRGCDNSHECSNGAKCVAFLENENLDLHNYTCECTPGFSGSFCRQSTTLSMNGVSMLVFNVNQNTRNISFTFRTTIPDAILTTVETMTNDIFKVYLSGGAIHLHINNQTIYSIQPVLNNGYWNEVFISFTDSLVMVSLNQSECTAVSCDLLFNQSATFKDVRSITFGSDITLPPYYGCMRDIKHNNKILDAQSRVVASNLEGGCNRQEVCQPDSCHDHGICVDLWSKFRCECLRPYIGNTCDLEIRPATFGYLNKKSFALFKLLEPPKQVFNISMFIKTLQPDGNIVLTSNLTDSTSVIISLLNGKLQVTIAEETHSTNTLLTDGIYHFIMVEIVNDKLNILIDQNRLTEVTLSSNINVTTSSLYIAGLPTNTGSRKRRETSSVGFKGAIQDVQFNGVRLLFHHNDTGNITISNEPIRFLPSQISNVLIGQVSDPVCGSANHSLYSNPCHNGGDCDVIFNDYMCNCTDTWKGRNCDVPVFCKQITCPGPLQCIDLKHGGFECIGAATFDHTTIAMYTTDPNTVVTDTLSFNIRTRSVNASIIQFRSKSGTIQLNLDITGRIQFLFYSLSTNGSVASAVSISDANWHNVTVITPRNSSLSLLVDGNHYYTNVSLPEALIGQISNSTDNLAVIGAIDQGLFKGCLSDVRIGGVALPFYDQSQLTNHSSATGSTHTIMTSSLDISSLGCHGDNMCGLNPCENNGTCLDLFNKFECRCKLGFVDEICSTNVDNCVGVECNNGSCVDLVDDFVCNCTDGYQGYRCERDIDECINNPCFNNGTCRNLIGSFECQCMGQTMGALCEINVSQSCNNGSDEPCQNGGACVNVTTSTEITHTCVCPPLYTGKNCQNVVNHCKNITCLNNGSCLSNLTSYTCSCMNGFYGEFCENYLGACSTVTCMNNATCDITEDGFQCNCKKGYVGRLCEVNDLCHNNNNVYCSNNGNCSSKLSQDHDITFSCDCLPTHAGDRCNHNNPCYNHTCHNGGSCSLVWANPTPTTGHQEAVAPTATCVCSSGYTGNLCENNAPQTQSLWVILGPIIGAAGLVFFLGLLIALLCYARGARASRGVYSPQATESAAATTHATPLPLKVPPERLI
uniref:protein crumbs homolog 1 isoform X3 n=1 Tax=Ciona intestinalis TaxID=7719 RepID=UPI000EF48764|nr:protein crumbs homolog 1 isoform X3 [Ciona intestinalis]|eukprot:XP_026693146.1 protein crumbs homolog 1 isoform X3 [Ciona intestinalis]